MDHTPPCVLLCPCASSCCRWRCLQLPVHTAGFLPCSLCQQVLQVQVFGGSPFAAGSWAFGGRATSATAPSVRLLIGDGWPSGARVQLEFPYTFR